MKHAVDMTPDQMVGRTIFKDAGGARWLLVGDRIDVTKVVAKADLVAHLKAEGCNGASGKFYDESPRSGDGLFDPRRRVTNADITARHFISRDTAEVVLVGTIVRAKDGAPAETWPNTLINLRDVALVCESADEIAAVLDAKADFQARAMATRPDSNFFIEPITTIDQLRQTMLEALVNPPDPAPAP